MYKISPMHVDMNDIDHAQNTADARPQMRALTGASRRTHYTHVRLLFFSKKNSVHRNMVL